MNADLEKKLTVAANDSDAARGWIDYARGSLGDARLAFIASGKTEPKAMARAAVRLAKALAFARLATNDLEIVLQATGAKL